MSKSESDYHVLVKIRIFLTIKMQPLMDRTCLLEEFTGASQQENLGNTYQVICEREKNYMKLFK